MTKPSIILAVLACCASSACIQAAPEGPAVKDDKKTSRAMPRPDDRIAKEPQTFLGVHATAINDTLTAQLGLAEGVGLVVQQVVPDSPAAGVIQPHDILLKLDDQLLIDVRQFAVLIHARKAGDDAALQLVRKGKEQTVHVKLVQRDMPKNFFNMRIPGGEGGQLTPLNRLSAPTTKTFEGWRNPRDGRVEDVLRTIKDGRAEGPGVHVFRSREKDNDERDVTIINGNKTTAIFSDGEGTLELRTQEGQKSLVARDPKGMELFRGPINAPEERAKLPASIRPRLEKIETMDEFSFSTDDDFQGVRVRELPVEPRRIALPPTPLTPGVPQMGPLLAFPDRPGPVI